MVDIQSATAEIRRGKKERKKKAHTATTTTILRPFVRNYPGEPVPEETFTYPVTTIVVIQPVSSSIYHDP